MLVQRVVSPTTRLESWTVLGAGDLPVGPIERYPAYLTDIERSPNTVKAYAHDLKDYFVFLGQHGLDWRVETRRFADAASARREIFRWIAFYNHRRRHSRADYLTPVDYENQYYETSGSTDNSATVILTIE